ncbi:Ig-like domain-containing protein [Gilvimarinus agarilyticus]|uniref:LamG-like jellyroll fold domain-containing protein n=1 Tax=Gilvimarinus sp. 2_MG-2023 TaxID=3062666 RepID=UPI001C0884C8|nr:LamG-like jellyroll fold domain-containing protein [Gilvimarinus sp. 2_MG-2023]MBU2886370.1 Ig-like domain-containing protein [Gilvimarinus agarilyticus]MDO6571049.1 LamG-like jellyroll fold domain-containing protein [Gilvimarinus sp. 2_MG-2023]
MKLSIPALMLTFVTTAALAEPERPAIDRTIHMAEGHVTDGSNRHWLNPYVPPLTTSKDGRIGLTHRPYRGVFFRLIKPENIDVPFLESAPGMQIMSQHEYLDEMRPDEDIPSRNTNGHMTLCDPSGDMSDNPLAAPNRANANPYACGTNGQDDCYDLTVISHLENRHIGGTDVHVRVSNPKTVDAQIAEITVGETSESDVSFTQGSFFEPSITGDGHLMVSRTDNANIAWRHPSGGNRTTESDIVYYVNDNPDNFAACDVRQFTNRYPIGHAPYDDTINERYGFAMHPFETLDNRGNRLVLPDGFGFGTYPWIDKDGANITFTSIGGRLSSAGYPTRCPPEVQANYGGCSGGSENSPLNGRTLLGLWTRGKMVLLDNMINHMDNMEDVRETSHRDVLLYEPGNGDDGYKRVGDTRSRDIYTMPNGNVPNSSFFDSNEHRFNYLQNMRPISPADVTWLMSTGRSTDEVVFDDYLNANGFIVSHMVQPLRINTQYNVKRALDGHIQNSATSPNWNKPNAGEIIGDGRVEIVANGGFTGKGYWLDGDNIGIEYSIPAQPQDVLSSPWYYSLFVDSRNNSGQRSLIQFPDGSEIRLQGSNQIVFVDNNGGEIHSVTSVSNIPLNGWTHLGFQLSDSNRQIETYINGYKVDTFNTSNALFVLSPGTLSLGSSGNGNSFRGWIDDFKVFAETVNPEVACNHAKGTLAGLTSGAASSWQNIANGHPNTSHQEVSSLLSSNGKSTFNRYVCYHDYSDDYAAHLQNIPQGLRSVREDINFPEGPLRQDRPRPESRQNAFCTSCHTADGRSGLDLEALALRAGINAPDDERRQPLQPDPFVYGNIPANWISPGVPATRQVSNRQHALNIDTLLLGRSGGSGTGQSSSQASSQSSNQTSSQSSSQASSQSSSQASSQSSSQASSQSSSQASSQSSSQTSSQSSESTVDEGVCGPNQPNWVQAEEVHLDQSGTVQLHVGETMLLNATVLPTCVSQPNVNFQSSNWRIVRPNNSGLMTARGPGQAVITVVSKADPTVTDSINILVSP